VWQVADVLVALIAGCRLFQRHGAIAHVDRNLWLMMSKWVWESRYEPDLWHRSDEGEFLCNCCGFFGP
jgi:hypothetical protein